MLELENRTSDFLLTSIAESIIKSLCVDSMIQLFKGNEMPKFDKYSEIVISVFLIFVGYFLVHAINDNSLSAQVAITLVFFANILTLLADGRRFKIKVRGLTAAFLFGALGGLILV